jgi:GNAT superfamily N-acetyltransferase
VSRAQIREASRDDLPGVVALYRELRPDDPVLTPQQSELLFDALLADPNVSVIVAEANRIITSTAMLAIVPNLAHGGQPFGVIEHVITAAAHRRKGYAREVLESALRLAWSRRCYKVLLLSGAERSEAHRLYESVGFRGGIERGYVAKPARPNIG